MKKLLLSALLALSVFDAPAQRTTSIVSLRTQSACGTLPAGVTYAAGQYGIFTMDTMGRGLWRSLGVGFDHRGFQLRRPPERRSLGHNTAGLLGRYPSRHRQ